MSAEENHMNK